MPPLPAPTTMNPKTCLGFLLPFVLTLAASAEVPAQGTEPRPFHLDRVLWDTHKENTLWAAGPGFKMSFGAEGATYIPFLGSDAPHDYPVHFRVSSIRAGGKELGFDAAARPQKEGERVSFDRGLVREVYELSPQGVEQLFVFDQHAFAGDLVVRLALETELAPGSDAEGLVLSNERGGLRYSSAVTLDARGARAAAPTAWKDGEIEIVVPASTLAAAEGALTIDPFITNYIVNGSTSDLFAPDIAWSNVSSIQMVVYELYYSATDSDLLSQALNINGQSQSLSFVDASTDNCQRPSVAHNGIAGNFFCVYTVGSTTSGTRWVQGNMLDPTGVPGPDVIIDNGFSGERINAVVGGDSYFVGPTYYLVVYEHAINSTDHNILARLVSSSGLLQGSGPITIEGTVGTLDREPVISKTDGGAPDSTQAWTIAWTRSTGLFAMDLYGAQVRWSGTVVTPTFPIDTTSAITYSPSVSSPLDDAQRTVLVTYTSTPTLGADPTIVARTFQGATQVDSEDLIALAGGLTGQMQLQSAVDSDGRDFLVVWTELVGTSTTNTDIFGATVTLVGTQLALAGSQMNVINSPAADDQVRICTTRSSTGTPRRGCVVAHGLGTGTVLGDIYGARIDASPFTKFCTPGAGPTIACPCGNVPTGANRGCENSSSSGGGTLDASGNPDTDSVVLAAASLRPNATCVFLQGATSNPAGVAFGDGVRCASGQLLRLSVKTTSAGSASTFPVAGDPSIQTRCQTLGAPIWAGMTRAYQVYYRDPANFGCAAGTFNITSALQVQW